MPETGIQSDLEGASQQATALKTAADILKQESSVTTDVQTTIAGNEDARKAIQVAQEMAKQIAEAVSSASCQLHSVAEDFEATDQQVGQQFQSIGGL